jgi:recombinational DNA repair protein RecT
MKINKNQNQNQNQKQEKPVTAIELIDVNKEKLKNSIIRTNGSFDLFLKSAIELIENDENLSLALTSEKGCKSIVNALSFGASLCLPLNPLMGLCCLVSYADKAGNTIVTYQVEKNGLTLLGKEQGWEIFACTIHENDEFEGSHNIDGDDFTLKTKMTNRGKPIGFLASGKNKNNGSKRFETMSLEQVIEHGRRFASSTKVKSLFFKIDTNKEIMTQIDKILRDDTIDYFIRQSSWIKSFCPMGEKTVIKKLLARPDFSVISGTLLGIIDQEITEEEDPIVIEKSEVVARKIEIEKEKPEEKKDEVF